MRLPHTPGADIIYELSENLYPSSLEPFREAIANALDEGSRKVAIEVSLKEIVMEDWGEGISEMERFTKFGDASKAKQGGETIGEKGLGKLSLLQLGKNVNFRTNNGEIGMNIIMTPEYFDYETRGANKFLDHKGTRIAIPNPIRVPPILELEKYLKKAFSLRIARGIQITLNGVQLEPKTKIDIEERLICKLKGSIEVTGNIKEDKKGHGSLDVYIKHVFIQSVLIDPERRFSGWVNCNALKPTTARNDIRRDPTYEEFVEHLKQHCWKFPKVEEEISRTEVLLGNELDRMLRSYLKATGLKPFGSMLTGKGKEEALDKHERKPKEGPEKGPSKPEETKPSIHSVVRTDKRIRRTVRSETGIMWVDADLGNDNEPVFFERPNTIYKNRTNDIYKFARKSKVTLGPSWLRLMPYMARAVIQMHPDYEKWERKQVNLEMDKAVRYFLKFKGVAA